MKRLCLRLARAAVLAFMMPAAAVLPARAQQPAGNGIEVERAWARATPGGAHNGAAYLSIVNKGSAPDRLVAVASPVAAKAELHESRMENGVMMMRQLGAVTIDPGKSLALKPGADHVMLLGLKRPLKEGESFPLTLTFEKSGDVQVTVEVAGVGAMGSGAMDHGGMSHGDMNGAHGDMPMKP